MAKNKTNPLVTLTLAASAVAGLVGAAYYYLLRRPLHKNSGTQSLPGLLAPVEIIRDRWGIPHIYAQKVRDLYYAQGYVHAQDRLWQMDFNRRLVAGRVSELFGEISIPLDRWMRTLRMRATAEKEPALLSQEELALMHAYAEGVNARIAQGRLPIEFTLLGAQPEPWTVVDSLSWVKMMAWTLSVNWETEILRSRIIARLGAELAAELEPPYAPGKPFVIPAGVDYSCIGPEAMRRASAARPFTGPNALDGVGSNNWVIGGSLTSTGKPLLANDMHLGLAIPAVWYENHLVAGDHQVTGITFPGIPGIVSGHNGHVAWGFTNGFPDVQDLFMENFRRTEAGQVEYEFQGKWHPAEVHQEVIQVKGSQPVTEEVIVTHHGPIINGLASNLAGETPLALRWTAHDPSNMLRALFNMNRAHNCQEFREALRDWYVPIQNTVYADTDGNIAYSYPGRVPRRMKSDGSVPVPGWTGEYEWLDYLPFDELPHMFNPDPGYIATANNRTVDSGYPHFLSNDFIGAGRIERIHELIQAADKIDSAYIQKMHMDQVSTAARRMAQRLEHLSSSDPELQIALERLQKWDGSLAVNSAEAAIYEVLVQRLVYRLLEPRLGDLAIHYMGKGITPILSESSLLGERAREWLEYILDQPDSHWFDLGHGESRDEQLKLALREAIDFLKNKLGPDMATWTWGHLHTLTLAHTLGAKKPLDRLFNRGPFPVGGNGDTIWNTMTSLYNLETAVVVGPPFRFIADLSNLGLSQGQLLPGQSGQPASPHYADNIDAWFKGEYHPMLFRREDILANAEATLILTPAIKTI